jgi:hypothetical protein
MLPAGIAAANYELIWNPDFSSPEQNAARLTLLNLYRNRAPIISCLPCEPDAKLVDIAPDELQDLYLVPSSDWYTHTGGTFRLIDAPANIGLDRRPKIEALKRQLVDYDATTTTDLLILISASSAGPYTIIDGNNRAIALYEMHRLTPNMPWRAMLIDDPRCAYSIWFIGSALAKAKIANMRRVNQL